MSPRRLSTCPGLVISFPGRTRWAVVFGRVLSQIDPGLGCAVIAIAGETNAIEINIAAANLRMVTPFGPDLLPFFCPSPNRASRRCALQAVFGVTSPGCYLPAAGEAKNDLDHHAAKIEHPSRLRVFVPRHDSFSSRLCRPKDFADRVRLGLRHLGHRRRHERHRDQQCSSKRTHEHFPWPGSVGVIRPSPSRALRQRAPFSFCRGGIRRPTSEIFVVKPVLLSSRDWQIFPVLGQITFM
jgi:hypothetical protein